MVTVPVSSGNQVARAARPIGAVQPVSNPTAAAIGEGMARLGYATSDAAQTLHQIRQEQNEINLKGADNELSEAIDGILYAPETGLRSQRGQNAVDGYEPAVEAIRQARGKIREQLKGDDTLKKRFDMISGNRIADAQRVISVHVAQQQEGVLDDANLVRSQRAFIDAGNSYTDPAIAQKYLDLGLHEIAMLGARQGWSADEIALKQFEARSGVRKGIAGRLTDVDPDLGEKYFETYKDQFGPSDADEVHDGVRIRRSQIAAEVRRQEAAARQAEREEAADVSEQARLAIEVMSGGGTFPGKSIEQLAVRLDKLDKPILALQLRQAGETQSTIAETRPMRPDQLQGWINERKAEAKGNPSPVQSARIAAGEKVLGQMRAGLKADPLSWAVTAGVASIGPVDLNDATSVQRRVRTAVAVADRYGTPLTFLTDEEASLYAGTIAKASPQQKVDMTQSIVKQFGRYGRDVLGSISGVDPIFAHAGGLAVSVPGGKETAARIFAGQQAWKDKAVALPSAEAFQAAPGLGQALAFNTKTRSALLSSAKAIYASEAAAGSLDPKVVDEETWQKALNRAAGATYQRDGSRVGGLGVYRGVNIVLPPSVAPDEFGTLMGRLTDDDLKAIGAKPTYGNGKPVAIDALKSGYLFDAGSGRYLVALDRNGTQFLTGPKGHFVLDVNALLPRLRARAPHGIMDQLSGWLGF